MPDIELTDSPTIPGVLLRPFRSLEDLPAMAEVFRAANEANGVTAAWTEERLRVELDHRADIDPYADDILAFVEDRLVACSRIEWADTVDGERLYGSLGFVHPDWRHRGLGGMMMTRNEDRLRELAAGHEHPGARSLMTWIEDADMGATALVVHRGYRRVRVYQHMVRPDMEDIRLPALPAGLEVRPVTTDTLPTVWDGLSEAFRDHYGDHDGSEDAFRRWSQNPDFDADLLVVAFEGDEVAGGVLSEISQAENATYGYWRGWPEPAFTRLPWRRRGLASALMGRALVRLRDRGMTSAQVTVDSANPTGAQGLVALHRFTVDRSSSEWRKPLRWS